MKHYARKVFHGGGMTAGAYDSKGRRKYLTAKECALFLEAAALRGNAERAFCETLYFTGCRVSEAILIRKSDLDGEAGVVRIRSLKKRGKEQIRRLPIPEGLSRVLLEFSTDTETERIWKISRTTAWRRVKAIMGDAGIVGIQACPKGLRHGFGVRAALNHIPISLISNWMGHADISTTAIYLDVRDEEERELISRTW